MKSCSAKTAGLVLLSFTSLGSAQFLNLRGGITASFTKVSSSYHMDGNGQMHEQVHEVSMEKTDGGSQVRKELLCKDGACRETFTELRPSSVQGPPQATLGGMSPIEFINKRGQPQAVIEIMEPASAKPAPSASDFDLHMRQFLGPFARWRSHSPVENEEIQAMKRPDPLVAQASQVGRQYTQLPNLDYNALIPTVAFALLGTGLVAAVLTKCESAEARELPMQAMRQPLATIQEVAGEEHQAEFDAQKEEFIGTAMYLFRVYERALA